MCFFSFYLFYFKFYFNCFSLYPSHTGKRHRIKWKRKINTKFFILIELHYLFFEFFCSIFSIGWFFEFKSPINGGQTNTYQPICLLREAQNFLIIVVDSAGYSYLVLGVYFVVDCMTANVKCSLSHLKTYKRICSGDWKAAHHSHTHT